MNTLRFLFEHGADVDAKGKGGETSLRCAAYKGHDEMIKELLGWGADLNFVDASGKAALHHVCTARLMIPIWHINTVLTLLEAGADPDLVDESGQTPLQLATDEVFERVMELLQQHNSKKKNWRK